MKLLEALTRTSRFRRVALCCRCCCEVSRFGISSVGIPTGCVSSHWLCARCAPIALENMLTSSERNGLLCGCLDVQESRAQLLRIGSMLERRTQTEGWIVCRESELLVELLMPCAAEACAIHNWPLRSDIVELCSKVWYCQAGHLNDNEDDLSRFGHSTEHRICEECLWEGRVVAFQKVNTEDFLPNSTVSMNRSTASRAATVCNSCRVSCCDLDPKHNIGFLYTYYPHTRYL